MDLTTQKEKEIEIIDRVFFIAGMLGVLVVALCVIWWKVTGKSPIPPVPPCMIHAVTGIYCPGCGGHQGQRTRCCVESLCYRFITIRSCFTRWWSEQLFWSRRRSGVWAADDSRQWCISDPPISGSRWRWWWSTALWKTSYCCIFIFHCFDRQIYNRKRRHQFLLAHWWRLSDSVVHWTFPLFVFFWCPFSFVLSSKNLLSFYDFWNRIPFGSFCSFFCFFHS